MSNNDNTLRELARGFRKRTLVTTKFLMKVGMDMAKKGMGFDGAVQAAGELANDSKVVAAAEKLLAELGGLKGLVMKMGQMASYLDGSLPPAAQRVLAKLQAQSQPMVPDKVFAILENELGRPASQAFDHIDPQPCAAASIGQVHRARLGDDEWAVKIQYPGIDEVLRDDLRTVGRLTRFATLLSNVDGPGLVRELGDRVLEECDYTREAANLGRFASVFAGRSDVAIPPVLASHSTRRVLTTRWVGARNFQTFVDEAPVSERTKAATAIYDACFQGIFRYHAYNADPHPGNYLFGDDGHVTLLDFGCVKYYSPDFIVRWKRVAKSVLNNSLPEFREAFIDAGFVAKVKRFDFEHQFEAVRYLYQPMLNAEFTFTQPFISKVHDVLMMKNANKFKLDLPPDWLFVNRLQFGLFSVLGMLRAPARYAEHFRAAVESLPEPITPP